MKLATIEKIQDVFDHPNADKLEFVKVLGYNCIVPKGKYTVGDTIVFIQPDTTLPKDEEWAEEYLKYSPKRVKAVKLRGEWSEGIVMPINIFYDYISKFGVVIEPFIGLEVSKIIGVTKYEPPLPTEMNAKGRLPYDLCKTDEDRFENIDENKLPFGEIVDVSEKIDGQSVTFGYKVDEDNFFVTSRSLEISTEHENRYTVHMSKVKDKIIEYCKKYIVSLAFRGESYGNRIQNNKLNPYSNSPHSFAVFSVWNLDKREYEEKDSKHYYVNVCKEAGLETVPMIEENVKLTKELLKKYSVDLKKINDHYFEGVVIKHSNGSFKVINKYYDMNK